MDEQKPHFKKTRLTKEPKAPSKRSDTSQVPALKKKPIPVAQINRNLRAIYKEDDGTMPNMHHFAHGGAHRWRRSFLLGAAILLLCSSAAWAGFFIFGSRGPTFSEEAVRIDITGPSSVGIGDEVTYHVRVSNNQPLQLSATELVLQYPEGFQVKDTSLLPLDAEKKKWRFGVLDNGQSAELAITGTLYGHLQTQQSLRAFFTYRPSNFNSEFQNIANFTQTFDRTSLSLTIDAPQNASPWQNLEVPLILQNSSDHLMGPLTLTLDLGTHFALLPPEKKREEKLPQGVTHPEPLVWKINEIQPQAKLTFLVNGSYTSDAIPTEKIAATASIAVGDTSYELTRAEKDIQLADSSLSLSLIANGATGPITIAPEDTLTFSLFYKNTGKNAIKNLTLKTIFDSPATGGTSVLLSKTVSAGIEPIITTESINPDLRRIILEWGKKQSSALGSIAVGKENNIPFTMALASKSAIDYRKLTQFTILVHAEGEFDNGTKVSLQTQPITITISSDTSFTMGIEPVDPATTDTTTDTTDTYRIIWRFSNSVHPLKDILVKANLVGDIEWLGQESSAGTVAFDSKTKNVRWSIPSIAAGTNNQDASFIIHLKGTAPGQTLLMTQSTLEATDATVNKPITRTTPAIELP